MSRRWIRTCPGVLSAAVLAFGAAAAAAQDDDAKEPAGIAVGEKAPDFKLKDQAAKERSLKELIGEPEKEAAEDPEKDVFALVFYRSADW